MKIIGVNVSKINKFILRDVRCFADKQEFNIRPLTFLVGENSSGKSTVLGCIQALSNLLSLKTFEDIDFNSEPYQMGSFANIVSNTKSAKKDFELAFEYKNGEEGKKIQHFLTFTEKSKGSDPVISKVKWIFEKGQIIFSIKNSNNIKKDKDHYLNVTIKQENKFNILIDKDFFLSSRFYSDLNYLSRHLYFSKNQKSPNNNYEKLLNFIEQQFEHEGKKPSKLHFLMGYGLLELNKLDIHSIAPIRSKPKRTYDPLTETETPEGSEIPMVLNNLNPSNWKSLSKKLSDFGETSGLFSEITVRKFDFKNDPFQLQIKVRGAKNNLMDVGYGVSQVLPILVRIFRAKMTKFLLQQPEVHLHPKGQAELSSLLVNMIQKNKNSFIVETHSDYMIDRARIEIMQAKIKPEDVSLIYLEPVNNKIKVHNLCFDKEANILKAPKSYREFFLKEGDKLLGF